MTMTHKSPIFETIKEPNFTNPQDLESEENIKNHIINLNTYKEHVDEFLVTKGESIDSSIFQCNEDDEKTNLMEKYNKWTQKILSKIEEIHHDLTMYTTLW